MFDLKNFPWWKVCIQCGHCKWLLNIRQKHSCYDAALCGNVVGIQITQRGLCSGSIQTSVLTPSVQKGLTIYLLFFFQIFFWLLRELVRRKYFQMGKKEVLSDQWLLVDFGLLNHWNVFLNNPTLIISSECSWGGQLILMDAFYVGWRTNFSKH